MEGNLNSITMIVNGALFIVCFQIRQDGRKQCCENSLPRGQNVRSRFPDRPLVDAVTRRPSRSVKCRPSSRHLKPVWCGGGEDLSDFCGTGKPKLAARMSQPGRASRLRRETQMACPRTGAGCSERCDAGRWVLLKSFQMASSTRTWQRPQVCVCARV